MTDDHAPPVDPLDGLAREACDKHGEAQPDDPDDWPLCICGVVRAALEQAREQDRAEIERLRERLRIAAQNRADARLRADKVEAEIERLRAEAAQRTESFIEQARINRHAINAWEDALKKAEADTERLADGLDRAATVIHSLQGHDGSFSDCWIVTCRERRAALAAHEARR